MTPQDALAAALEGQGFVRGVAQRYGRFNSVYYEQSAAAILAALDGWVLVNAETLAAAQNVVDIRDCYDRQFLPAALVVAIDHLHAALRGDTDA